ncbi:MAG: hypothetical protein WD981_07105 [Gaiellaceae bacterium]
MESSVLATPRWTGDPRRPRAHVLRRERRQLDQLVDDEAVHWEGGTPVEEMDRLEAAGHAVTRWRKLNLFFGGVSAVEWRGRGELAAAGDPRRGGHGIVVE